MRVPGFIIVGPKGAFPGTFNISRTRALEQAPAVAILNRYRAADVRVRAAVVVIAADRGWCMPSRMRAKVDARVAELQAGAIRDANRVGRGGREPR